MTSPYEHADAYLSASIQAANNQHGATVRAINIASGWKAKAEAAEVENARLRAELDAGAPAEPPVVEPPVVEIPWTHAYRGCTADEAKEILPPGWEESRAGLPERTPKHGRTELKQGVDVTVENVLFTGPSAGYEKQVLSLYHTTPNGKPGNLTLHNVGLKLAPGGDYKSLNWFLRAYNLRTFQARYCDIEGVGQDGRARPLEHAFYDSVAGNTYVGYCLFRNLGGKGPYGGYRDQPYEQYKAGDNVPLAYRPVRSLEGNRIIDCEQDAQKSSFSDTEFDPGTPDFPATVRRSNNVIVAAWDFQREQGNNKRMPLSDTSLYHPVRACGAFVHTSYQHQEDYASGLYERENEVIHLTQANHPIGVVRNAEVVRFAGLCVETRDHRNPYIDINSKDARHQGAQKRCSKVIVEDCVSSSKDQVRIWHADGSHTLIPLDCPGKRITYDAVTGEVTEAAVS